MDRERLPYILFQENLPSMFSAHPYLAHESVCLHYSRAEQTKSQWFVVRLKLFHGKCKESSFPSLVWNAGQSNSRGLDLASGAKEGHQDAILLSGRQQQLPAVSSLHFTSTTHLLPEQQLFLPARAAEKNEEIRGNYRYLCFFQEGRGLVSVNSPH